jgi:hypothetical protein
MRTRTTTTPTVTLTGENHRHGASSDRFIAHVAMQQADEDRKPVDFGRHVDEDEYPQPPTIGEGDR